MCLENHASPVGRVWTVSMGADGRRREGWFTSGCIAQAAPRISGGPLLVGAPFVCLLKSLLMDKQNVVYLYIGILFSHKRV